MSMIVLAIGFAIATKLVITQLRQSAQHVFLAQSAAPQRHAYLGTPHILNGWDISNLYLSAARTEDMLQHEYARSTLKQGLRFDTELGTNPFKFEMVGSADSHTALTAIEENNQIGTLTPYEPNPDPVTRILKTNNELGLIRFGWKYASTGYTEVWARENTRKAIFSAMEPRETYATTGPRMTVQRFGGWDFTLEDVGRNPTDVSYGEPQEQVYDVAWRGDQEPGTNGKLPPVGKTVNTDQWTHTIGSVKLAIVWTPPGFDPAQCAFYYGRLLEIPTPNWTDCDKVFFNEDLPEEVPLIPLLRNGACYFC